METFWKGAFVSTIRKHVAAVTYVPLTDMTPEGWKVLDYGALRPAAKRLLQDAVIEGKLTGFFSVRYDMDKAVHGGKEEYFYPADPDAVEEFQSEGLPETDFHNFGVSTEYRDGQFKDYAADASENATFARYYNQLSSTSSLTLAAALVALAAAIDEPVRFESYYESWGQEGEAIAIIAYVYRMNHRQLLDVADDFGVETDGLTDDEIREEIIEAIEEEEFEQELDSA